MVALFNLFLDIVHIRPRRICYQRLVVSVNAVPLVIAPFQVDIIQRKEYVIAGKFHTFRCILDYSDNSALSMPVKNHFLSSNIGTGEKGPCIGLAYYSLCIIQFLFCERCSRYELKTECLPVVVIYTYCVSTPINALVASFCSYVAWVK